MKAATGLLTWLVLPAVLLGGVSLYASQNARVEGILLDQDGHLVSGATVRIVNASKGFSRQQVTGSDGRYVFSEVPPASAYVISAEKNNITAFGRPFVVHVYDEIVVRPPITLRFPVVSPAVQPATPQATPPQPVPTQPPLPEVKVTPAQPPQPQPNPPQPPPPPQPPAEVRVHPSEGQPAPPKAPVVETAVVTGSVHDQSGKAVAGASVRLMNQATGFSQEQVTGSSGAFTFADITPSDSYQIEATKPGMATPLAFSVPVGVGSRTVEVPVVLGAEPLRPELLSTMMSGVIDNQAVQTLPLADRDFIDLALLVPGTYPPEQGSPLTGASLVVNGARADMNNFLLDGADDNDYTINQSLPFQLVEAMQEFRVQTSTSTAEFGRNAGAQINTISRSGSNSFHGELFEFNRNSALSALNPLSLYRGGTFDDFAQYARTDKLYLGSESYFPTSVLSDPVLNPIFQGGRNLPLNQNQFGANLGGPIKKDKAYFFFNWESFRAANARPVMERVPDETARNPALCDADYAPIYGSAACSAAFVNLLKLYPVPNVPTSMVTSQAGGFTSPVSNPVTGDVTLLGPQQPSVFGGAFYAGDSKNYTDSDNFLGRVDVQPTKSSNMSFKHNIQDVMQVQGGSLPATESYPGNGITVNGRNQNFSYNYTQQASPVAVNLFRFGWNRFRLNTLPLDHGASPLGIFQNVPDNMGFPSVLIGGASYTSGPYATLGAPLSAPDFRADSVWSLTDDLTRSSGKHRMGAGFEFRHNRLNVNDQAAERGTVAFFNVPFGAASGASDFASIARVSPQFGGVNGMGGLDRSFSDDAYNFFIQDSWQPHSNVAINAGLRYEINTAPVEARNRLVNDYPGATPKCGFICLMQSGSSLVYDENGISEGTANFLAPRAGFDTDYRNFGPHIGIAWSPGQNGRLVLRAGYALAFDQQSLQPSVNMLLNPPFVEQSALFFPFLSTTFPQGFLSPGSYNIATDWFPQPYSITARDPNSRSPYVHQFNFAIDRQLGTTAVLTASYVGSAGHRLLLDRLLLQCTAAAFNSAALKDDCFPPLGGVYNLGTLNGSVIDQENAANSSYQSFQVRLDTRTVRGLTVHAYYEWAHSIDNAPGSAVPPVFLLSPSVASLATQWLGKVTPTVSLLTNRDEFATLNNANPTLSLRPGLPIITTPDLLPSDSMNSADLAGQRASSDFDVRHRFVVAYIYDFPAWRRSRIGAGWQVAGITTLQTGQPYSVFGDFYGLPLRPNQVAPTAINNSNPDGAIDNGLPAGCNVSFKLPFEGAPGSCAGVSPNVKSSFDVGPIFNFNTGSMSRNTLIGPGLVNFDFAVLKNTGFRETGNLQFRVEFFNLFNHANFLQPVGDAGLFDPTNVVLNPSFGQILQSRPPREIQFALKLSF